MSIEDIKDSLTFRIINGIFISTLLFLPFFIYFNSVDVIEIHVIDKFTIEGVRDKKINIIETDVGVLENTDSFIFLKYNSDEIQDAIQPSEQYKVKTVGWDIPLAGLRKNVIKLHSNNKVIR